MSHIPKRVHALVIVASLIYFFNCNFFCCNQRLDRCGVMKGDHSCQGWGALEVG